ncbi:MAG: cytochrome c family protein [Burkholderiaceae bacterium]
MRDTWCAGAAQWHRPVKTLLTLALAIAIPMRCTQAADLGRKSFEVCIACHSLNAGEHGVGPSLYQIMGRAAGSAEGFRFSGPMKRSGIVWDRTTLSAFIRNPQEAIPGTRMPFSGMNDQTSIGAIVDYLEKAAK